MTRVADVINLEDLSMEMSVNTVIPNGLGLYITVFDADSGEIEYQNGNNVGSVLFIEGYDICLFYRNIQI